MKHGEKAELARLNNIGIYEYVSRDEVMQDSSGKVVKVKWVPGDEGSDEQRKVR